MRKLWQYQERAEPISLEPGVIPTPEKWLAAPSEPVRPSRFKAAVFAASLFFVSIVAPPIPTVDSWFQATSEPQRVEENRAYTNIHNFFVAPVVVPLSVFAWSESQSEPQKIKANQNYAHQKLFAPVFVPVADLKWCVQTSEPVRAAPNYTWITTGSFELDNAQRPEQIAIDKWFVELARPVLPPFTPYYYPYVDFKEMAEEIPEVIDGVPTSPTATSIVTEALTRAAFEVTTAEISRGIDEWLEEGKAIMAGLKHWQVLEDQYVSIPVAWSGELSDIPDDFGGLLGASLVYGTVTGTVVEAGARSVKLAVGTSLSENETRGKRIVILTNTGARQIRNITGYNEITRVVQVAPDWTLQPGTSSTYLVEKHSKPLYYQAYQCAGSGNHGTPKVLSIVNDKVNILPVPNDTFTYVVLLSYEVDLAKMDETAKAALLERVLRMWRAPLTEFVTAMALQDAQDENVFNTYMKAITKATEIARKDSFGRIPDFSMISKAIGELPA